MQHKTRIVYLLTVGSFIMITAFLCYHLLDSYVSLGYCQQERDERQDRLDLVFLIINKEFNGMNQKEFMQKISNYDFVDERDIFTKNNAREVYIGSVGFEFKDNTFSGVIFTPVNGYELE